MQRGARVLSAVVLAAVIAVSCSTDTGSATTTTVTTDPGSSTTTTAASSPGPTNITVGVPLGSEVKDPAATCDRFARESDHDWTVAGVASAEAGAKAACLVFGFIPAPGGPPPIPPETARPLYDASIWLIDGQGEARLHTAGHQMTIRTVFARFVPDNPSEEPVLTGFSWLATVPLHNTGSDLTFDLNAHTIAAAFQETQNGLLTDRGAAEIERLLAEVDLEAAPLSFHGVGRMEFADKVFYVVTVSAGSVEWRYRYTGSPPPQLAALHDYLWKEVIPLSACQSTEAVQVVEPCTFVAVF